ncbi:MAG: hypothetical protein HQK84_02710 [Nitrospinae bacterium]|nr:hypothetical protein [Nitrospinota bacterium]
MNSLIYTLLLLCIAFAVHLTVWKIRLPHRQTKVLLLIFFSTLLLGSFLFYLGNFPIVLFGLPFPAEIFELIQVATLFTAVTLAYMITYSAVEADSPSLVITNMIRDSMPEGINKEVFEERMNDDLLIKPRLKDLIIDKIAIMKDERYVLTDKGKLMAGLFATYRSILKAKKGG